MEFLTFAVEFYLFLAVELLVIFGASFQEDSPLEYPVLHQQYNFSMVIDLVENPLSHHKVIHAVTIY